MAFIGCANERQEATSRVSHSSRTVVGIDRSFLSRVAVCYIAAPRGPQPIISVTTNKTIRCVYVCGSTCRVRSTTRESNTARERYRMSIGCPSRSLVFSSTSRRLSLFPYLLSLSLSLLFPIFIFPPVYLVTLSHLLPPSSIYTRLRFCLLSFSSSSSFISLACLALSLFPSTVCFLGVFSIDYETTIDLPDCARDRGRYIEIYRDQAAVW